MIANLSNIFNKLKVFRLTLQVLNRFNKIHFNDITNLPNTIFKPSPGVLRVYSLLSVEDFSSDCKNGEGWN